ncbi:unnamed protein product [Linum trigynum]|uniref:Reverse transcriptase domain-containing protein n=1 Tax=Linum trigynum TaxID=586398 RepID=A0AAV2CRK4_9ROSI
MAVSFFKSLYQIELGVSPWLPKGFAALSVSSCTGLERPIDREKIIQAVKSMGNLKAPGKDGYQPIFYKRCWDTVGDSLVNLVEECFREPELISQVNETLFVLIPKKEAPESFLQFRPIGLSNVAYKTLAKCLVNRIKPLMGNLVHPTQTSFVPGRHISDNIIIVQEVVHSMGLKKGRKGQMALKIDLTKAYDRLSWNFVKEVITEIGLPRKFIDAIMACITSPTMQVLWNGQNTEEFKPSRGLRQGCPLSPYLFTLCLEKLSHLIRESIDQGKWKPIRLNPGGPQLSHIFFADDLILFVEASADQAAVIMKCLDTFCQASGQLVSREKSVVFFAKNTNRTISSSTTSILGMPATQDLGRYLGVPVLHGRVTKDTYRYILDRINSKLSGWKAKNLTLGGRVTLAISVLCSLPIYAMQATLLPISICDEIDKRIRGFIWGSTTEARKIHLVHWEGICRKKEDGGLGLRKAHELNLAYLTKLNWRFLKNPEELWVQVLQSKYFKMREGNLRSKTSSRQSNL